MKTLAQGVKRARSDVSVDNAQSPQDQTGRKTGAERIRVLFDLVHCVIACAKESRSRSKLIPIPIWMVLMPFPGGGDNIFQFRKSGLPAEFIHRLFGGGHQAGRISRAPWFF